MRKSNTSFNKYDSSFQGNSYNFVSNCVNANSAELIYPYDNKYLNFEEYLEFQWKKNKYNNLNISKVLSKLRYTNNCDSLDSESVISKGTDLNVESHKKLENNFDKDFWKENQSCFSDEVIQINRIIQNEIKEYIPKNFRIIKKIINK